MTGTDLATRDHQAAITAPPVMTQHEILQTFEVAKALAASGMFKDTRQAEQAFAKILIGRDLGLSPTQALMGIHVIEGKPELSANLQAAFVKRTPGHDYRVLELTESACEIAFLVDGEDVGRSRFTMDDAVKAGLAGRGPWKSYPRNMLFARAMSNGVAFFVPEVTGGVRVYSEGEIGGEERAPDVESEQPRVREPGAPATDAQKRKVKQVMRGRTAKELAGIVSEITGTQVEPSKAAVTQATDGFSKGEASVFIDRLVQSLPVSEEHPSDVPSDGFEPVEGEVVRELGGPLSDEELAAQERLV